MPEHIQIALGDDLHMKFKVVCTLNGTDMSEVIRKLIKKYVAQEEERKLIYFPKTDK